VMIDSAFNDPLVSRAAVAALLDAGIGVGVMREVSAQEQANTVIEADDEVANALQALLAGALGPIEKGAWISPVAGIDAAITLGADFVASVRNK
ncbi:MAG: hypothetical protein ACKOE7_06885, partial [Actinomycetota bacterium]